MPTNRVRTRLGVGESTDVTYSLGSATWTMSPANAGSLSGTSGPTVTYTAPDRADNSPVTITATGSGCTKTIVFTIVEPSSVRMERRPGTQKNHTLHQASTGFIADIYILPADVSFQNCSYLESDVDAVGRGCFQRYMETHHVGHDPSTSPIAIGPPVSDTSGSKVSGYDEVASFSGSNCDGGWTHSIPWSFQVGSGTPKRFATVDQTFDITAAGAATATKAGASASSNYNDATEVDPLFGT